MPGHTSGAARILVFMMRGRMRMRMRMRIRFEEPLPGRSPVDVAVVHLKAVAGQRVSLSGRRDEHDST